MRMRQVEAFRAVMQAGSVTGGAALLHLSQPSVSRLIADLERSVGFALFDRRGSRVHPTAQAHALFEAVRRSYVGLDLLDQAARRIAAHPVGTIRIAALTALATALLPPVIARLRARHPEVRVTVESLGQHAIEERVFLGQADLGLGIATEAEGIRSRPLARADYRCIMRADHPLAGRESVALADLEGVEFIGPMHEADALWNGIDAALADAGVTPTRRLETQHSQLLYAFVEAGLGVAIAEPFSLALFGRLGVIARPIAPTVGFDFAMLEPDIGGTPATVMWLQEQLSGEARAYLES